MSGRALVGTSGWVYPHWRGVLYPAGLPARLWLERYASVFPTVEVNYSFYRLPKAETFADWRGRVPASFTFAVKASRYITHVRRLRDCENALARLLDAAGNLGPRLGPILFQLPPGFALDLPRLGAFLDVLPVGPRFVFEFRDPTWRDDGVYAALRRRSAAVCAAASGGPPVPWVTTADFAYVRVHYGASGADYSEPELADLARRVAHLTDAGLDTYVYFNNDAAGYAVRNAQRLRELLEGESRLAAAV